MRFVYPAHLMPDPDGGYVVTFPDVPEAITAGRTREEAIAMGSEALGLALRWYALDKRELPAVTEIAAGLVAIPVSATDGLKLAVLEAFRTSGISKSELARRLGKDEKQVRRILDPDHPTKLPVLEQTLTLLGRRVVIDTIAA